ncbi:MAG: tyrosine-type recombinase/integrase [Verrucomicrobiota bacterium]
MKGDVSVSKRKDRANKPWRVYYYEDGKRRAKHFDTELNAETFADEKRLDRKLGTGELAMSQGDRILWAGVRASAERAGIPLPEAVEIAKRAIEDRRIQECSNEDLIFDYILWCKKRGLRERTIEDYEKHLKWLNAQFDAPFAELKGAKISERICSRFDNHNSRRIYRASLTPFFKWCDKQGKLDANAIGRIDWDRPRSDGQGVGILTPDEAEKLIHAVPANHQAAIALAMFAGIRTAGELVRLKWSHIRFDARVIDIPGEVAKTREFRRMHDLPENLWLWLNASEDRSGNVLKCHLESYRKFMERAREAAGIRVWVRDVMRHSFGSYGYHRGIEWCVDTMGHVGGFRTFQKHYKGAASKADSIRYFAIEPTKALVNS